MKTFISYVKIISLSLLMIVMSSMTFAQSKKITIISQIKSTVVPQWHSAYYTSVDGLSLRSKNYVSSDNGKSWQNKVMSFDNGNVNSQNSRRSHVTSLFLNKENRIVHFINTLDLKNIGLRKMGELPEGISNYYIRYYLSDPLSRNYIADIAIKENGKNDGQPFSGIRIGTNAYYLGDIGCQPIELNTGKILLPVQQSILRNGKLYNPGGTTTFTGARVLIGTMKSSGKEISWKASNLIEISPTKSTRGLIEPTIIELASGKLLMVMRGSNGGKLDRSFSIPGYKWYSISTDGGYNWSPPKELRFDDGSELFSPSSMSRLFKRSDGKIYWIGNISSENPKGNNPRNVLAIGEVDPYTYRIKKNSLIVLDSQKEGVEVSHFAVLEDRENKNIVISYPLVESNKQEWKVIRLK